jgi:hypothetical protein
MHLIARGGAKQSKSHHRKLLPHLFAVLLQHANYFCSGHGLAFLQIRLDLIAFAE